MAPISGESMGSLFKIPYGNGEQNIVTMAMSVIATHYLDLTNQWDKVGLYERKVAVKYIKIGKPYNMDIALNRTMHLHLHLCI